MSRQQQNRLRLAAEIQRYGTTVDFACDRCSSLKSLCIAMEDSRSRLKCSECVRAGKPCVNMSWQSLDRTREELSSKVAEDEKVLATVITRLLRNKKILKEIDLKARRKTQCLLSEVDAEEDSDLLNCPAADALVGLSPAIWSSMAMLDDFSSFNDAAESAGSGGIDAEASGNSEGVQ